MTDEVVKVVESTKFATITTDQIKKINSNFPEIYRASALIGHSTSQASYTVQTLNMLSDGAFSRMKQCLSQINKKRHAVMEAQFKIEKAKLEIKHLSKKQNSIKNTILRKSLTYEEELDQIKIREKQYEISETSILIENSIKEIGMFQNKYLEIMKNKNIPENWTEKDFEGQEIAHMIKMSFRLGIQNIMSTGAVSQAAVEYWEQLGINPITAETLTNTFVGNARNTITPDKMPNVTEFHQFLDDMAEMFKDEYKHVLKRIGVNELGSEEFMAKGYTKPQ